jgi:hypothetical protein
MKPRFAPDSQDAADGLFYLAGAEIYANFKPWAGSDGGNLLADRPSGISPGPSVSGQGHTYSVGPGGPDGDVAAVPDATACGDSNGATSAAIWSAPATSEPAFVALANPAAAFIGAYVTEADIADDGAIEAPAFAGYQISHAGLHAAVAADGVATAGVSVDRMTSALVPAAWTNPTSPVQGSFGITTSASIGSHGATAAQLQQALDESGLSVNGTGIKVGVLSDSFNDLGGAAADEADGALPPASDIQILQDLSSGGSDEGRAMMQIIHDIAPGADLAFYTAFNSEQDFANGILALAAAGCKVIVDDVSYSDEPFFQNGVVAQAIQTVEAEGVTYVTAAGNDGSNGYQAVWKPISGSFDGRNLTDAESFGGSLVQTLTINTEGTGASIPLVVEWNQPYGNATSDLEILVFNSRGRLVGTATNASSGDPGDPYAEFDFTKSGTYFVAIENLSGPDPGLIKEITAGDGLPATISGANSGTVVGHAMTPGAISAGAVDTADTPAFGVNPPLSESFSSSGAGAELLFANDGTALPAPDLLSPVVVSGVDDISTTVSGDLGDFFGTSAASASLAGVAALILSANPDLAPAQVAQIMEETALSMANSAVAGAGLVRVNPAVAAAEAAFDTQAPTLANDNPLLIPAGATQIIPSSLLSASDNVSSGVDLHFTVTTAPAGGILLLNGSPTSSFTQADVNSGLVSYQEIADGVTSDSFLFTVTDAAGNVTAAETFQINVDPAAFSGDRADYQMSHNTAAQALTVVDERQGSPDGTHNLSHVDQLQFADGLSIYDFDGSGNLVSETFDNSDGTHWINTFDTAGNQPWVWEISSYAANGSLVSQTGLNDDGTHWLTLYDVNNQYSWASATISFDAGWNWTSVTGTADGGGSLSLTAQDVAAAYDVAAWSATPFDTVVGQPTGNAVAAGSENNAVTGLAGAGTAAGEGTGRAFVFNFASASPASSADSAVGADHMSSEFGRTLSAGGAPSLTTATMQAAAAGHFTLDGAHTVWSDSFEAIAAAKIPALHTSDFLLA